LSIFFYQLPYFVVKMMPLATLLAILFSLGGMISRGEWKAGMAGGWRPFEMALPLLVCAGAAALLQLGVQETVAPPAFMKSEFIFQGKMWGRADWKRLARRDVSFSARPEIFVTAHLFDGGSQTMDRVLVNIYSAGKVSTEINANRARWDKASGVWIFEDGVLIKYGAGAKSRPVTTAFTSYAGPLTNPPDALIMERLVPDGVSTMDISDRIRRLRAIGAPVVAEKVQFYAKLAGPLANVVLAVTGMALVLLVRMNQLFSFGVALAAGFSSGCS